MSKKSRCTISATRRSGSNADWARLPGRNRQAMTPVSPAIRRWLSPQRNPSETADTALAEVMLQSIASDFLRALCADLKQRRLASTHHQLGEQLAVLRLAEHHLVWMFRQYFVRLALVDARHDRQPLDRSPVELVVLHGRDHALEHRCTLLLARWSGLRWRGRGCGRRRSSYLHGSPVVPRLPSHDRHDDDGNERSSEREHAQCPVRSSPIQWQVGS